MSQSRKLVSEVDEHQNNLESNEGQTAPEIKADEHVCFVVWIMWLFWFFLEDNRIGFLIHSYVNHFNNYN